MPENRRRLLRGRLQTLISSAERHLQKKICRTSKNTKRLLSSLYIHAENLKGAALHHRYAIALSLAILLLPAIAVQLMTSHSTFEGYDDSSSAADPVIVALLRGERLVEPAPLPPDVFMTKEILVARQEIATANREWARLEIDFRQRLLAVFQLMEKHGYQMALLEGYRSPERQASLALQGPHITNAGAFQSYHQFGLAADSAFYRGGKIVVSEKDPWAMEGYRLYGQYAESVGLIWGGKWQMKDFGHVELRKPDKLAQR